MSFWLKVMRETPDKPEIHLIAAELGLDPDAVFGKVFRIWAWFDEHTLDGTAPVTLASRLGDVGRHERIVDAMIKVGWIQRDESFLSLVSFEKHNGETARKRALSAERSRKYRVTQASRTNHKNVTPKKKNKELNPLNPPAPADAGGGTFVSDKSEKKNGARINLATPEAVMKAFRVYLHRDPPAGKDLSECRQFFWQHYRAAEHAA